MSLFAIVLAAGKGTRMKSELAKVLHRAGGRPLISWVMDAVATTTPAATVVVVGHQADAVTAVLPAGAASALQAEQLGTGHATSMGLAPIAGDITEADDVLVVPGDMPLIRGATLQRLVDHHRSGFAATLLTVELDDPTGYGRIVRDEGRVMRIVEQSDATPEELDLREVNTSVYVFAAPLLLGALARLDSDNAQGEQYLTDVIGLLVGDGHPVSALTTSEEEGMGVNTIAQLEDVSQRLSARAEPGSADPQYGSYPDGCANRSAVEEYD